MNKQYKRVSTKGLANKYNFKVYPAPFGIWFRSCIQGAIRRGLDFTFTLRQGYELSQGDCYYCGQKGVSVIDGFRYNGIDRIDNSNDYHFKNVVTCCKVCNAMKGKLSIAGFLSHVSMIAEQRIKEG